MSVIQYEIGRSRILLVFDLNGTLMFRSKHFSEKLINVKNIFSINSLKVMLRPEIESFCEFIFDNFDVAVWTSAMAHNAKKLVNETSKICPSFNQENLKFIYSRDKCTVTKWIGEEYEKRKAVSRNGYVKDLASKDLETVWKEFSTEYGPENTILIDDSSEKIVQPKNHILIPEFLNEKRCESDDCLEKLKEYLSQLKEWYLNGNKDVRNYLSQHHPFTSTQTKKEEKLSSFCEEKSQ